MGQQCGGEGLKWCPCVLYTECNNSATFPPRTGCVKAAYGKGHFTFVFPFIHHPSIERTSTYTWNQNTQTQTNDLPFWWVKRANSFLNASHQGPQLQSCVHSFTHEHEDQDGWKKDGEMWDTEWQLYSHRLILTSIHLHPSLLLAVWWREEWKGT